MTYVFLLTCPAVFKQYSGAKIQNNRLNLFAFIVVLSSQAGQKMGSSIFLHNKRRQTAEYCLGLTIPHSLVLFTFQGVFHV
ncbi:hypothetical protein HMPREF9418_0673 [Neisseria macacae ATCC 33926]|jgi:hypothetical protein|uniref:Uncharacterized protein n=1 Tax=Neisseria macacae ATCC 33926 TaxID=997348 RepID=A0AA36UL49_9NEIS|nr:hypothetical protein HMPREF9418_0673 [Neisseria macacae ATCC 33926]